MDSQLIHHMNPRVPEILSHFGQKHLHLLGLPAQKLSVESYTESFDTVFNLYKVPAAECFLRKRRGLAAFSLISADRLCLIWGNADNIMGLSILMNPKEIRTMAY